MRVEKYLAAMTDPDTGEKPLRTGTFARWCGVDRRNFYHLESVGWVGCTSDTAYRIVETTKQNPTPRGGTVTLRDLVKEEV